MAFLLMGNKLWLSSDGQGEDRLQPFHHLTYSLFAGIACTPVLHI